MYSHLTGPPLSPTDLRTSHVTAKSVVLSWVPGSDGGHDQTFSVKYSQEGEEILKLYKDGIIDSLDETTTVKVSTLYPETQYEFFVTAHNVYGDTKPVVISVETRGILVQE